MSEIDPAVMALVVGLQYLTTLVAIALPIIYQWNTKGAWRDSPVGIHLMSQAVVIAAMLVWTILGQLLPIGPFIAGAIILYAFLISVKVNQMRLIFKNRRFRKEATGDPTPTPSAYKDPNDPRTHA